MGMEGFIARCASFFKAGILGLLLLSCVLMMITILPRFLAELMMDDTPTAVHWVQSRGFCSDPTAKRLVESIRAGDGWVVSDRDEIKREGGVLSVSQSAYRYQVNVAAPGRYSMYESMSMPCQGKVRRALDSFLAEKQREKLAWYLDASR